MVKESHVVVVDPATGEIQGLRKTTFAEMQVQERQHLEKWVLDNPAVLGERLLILSTEFHRFDKSDKRLDILALDSSGKVVVVELKRIISDTLAELQAIRYAAFCSTMTFKQVVELRAEFAKTDESTAESQVREFVEDPDFSSPDNQPRIILAAGSFDDPNLMSCVIWLRTFRLDIRCVELAPYKLPDDRIILVPRTLIPLPEAADIIVSIEEKEAAEKTSTEKQRLYQERNKQILTRFRDLLPERAPGQAAARRYMQVPSGHGGIHYEWAHRSRPRPKLEVALHLETSSKERNRDLCEALRKHRSEIEAKTGESLTFDPDWRGHWTAIFMQRDADPWSEVVTEWAATKMAALIGAVQPLLGDLCRRRV